ncbi:2-iminoacetate synthase ThiH [Sesbania bispinosa]|nr:2-iminoacetate synthase ThiH [Sesbania bispinosa]
MPLERAQCLARFWHKGCMREGPQPEHAGVLLIFGVVVVQGAHTIYPGGFLRGTDSGKQQPAHQLRSGLTGDQLNRITPSCPTTFNVTSPLTTPITQ